MNKIKISAFVMLIIVITATLSGCFGSDKISGKYVCTTNKELYFDFSDNNIVKIHSEAGEADGMYITSDKNGLKGVLVTVSGQSLFLLINDDAITDSQNVYKKETFWGFIKENWVIILIVFVVIIILYNIIDRVVIKKTGKDLESHLDDIS